MVMYLHPPRVDANWDGSILDQPLRHFRLVFRYVNWTVDVHSHLRTFKCAIFVFAVVRIIFLCFQTTWNKHATHKLALFLNVQVHILVFLMDQVILKFSARN